METTSQPEHLNNFIPDFMEGAVNVTASLALQGRSGSADGGRQGTAVERTQARRQIAMREENSKRLDAYLRVSRDALVCEARKILSCRSSAEDAVQEAAIKALQTPNQFDSSRVNSPERGFRAWFHQILTNVCIDSRRATSKRISAIPFTSLPEILVEEASVDPAPEVWEQVMRRIATNHGDFHADSIWEMTEDTGQLNPMYEELLSRYTIEDFLGCYERLSATDKHILTICKIEEKEEVDAAKEMNCTANLVRSRLSNAIQHLQSNFRQLDYDRVKETTPI
jgi:RNA polymerase sigma factor (sigma-70 family)